jgi:hypothetical protein
VPLVFVVDVFDVGEERGELLDRLPSLRPALHEVLEVVRDVDRR